MKKIFSTLLLVLIAIALGVGIVFGFIWWDKNHSGSDKEKEVEKVVSDKVIQVPSEVGKIQDAIDAASDGDTIKIAAGTFRDLTTENGIIAGIRVTKALTIEGAGRDKTIVDGHESGSYGIFIPQSVTGKVVIKDMAIVNFKNDGVFTQNKLFDISGLSITASGNRGAYIKDASHDSKFHNNIVYANRFTGVHSEKSGVQIYNNTIANNGTTGISFVLTDTSTKTTSPEIYNNIITGNADYGVLYFNPAFPKDAVVDHNNVFANGASYFEYLNNERTKTRAVDPTPGTGNLSQDPKYIDLESFVIPDTSSLKKASRSGGEIGVYGK